jgi:hypothetical protein
MPNPKNKSYFPLRRLLSEHHELSRKQLSAVKRALAKQGRKLPKPGWCAITTKIGGKFTNIVASSEHSTSEVCHDVRVSNGKPKHVYTLRASPARNRGR